MAYSDFTFAKLKSKFGLHEDSISLFGNIKIEPIRPSEKLQGTLEDIKGLPLNSEKAKSEAIIFPIILELKKNNPQISIFSGYTFNVDSANGLVGAPDFIISAIPRTQEPHRPIFALVESKNKSTDEGFAQCAAEMYAAQLVNEQAGTPIPAVYGVVTNAFEWVFVKLENHTIYVDTDRYYLNELPKLLGTLQYIINTVAPLKNHNNP